MALGSRNMFRRHTGRPNTVPAAEPRGERRAAEAPARRTGRARLAAARGAWAAGSLMLLVVRVVRLVAGLVVLVIAAAIVLRVAGANQSNSIVSDIHDAGGALAAPFKNMFTLKDAKADMAVNWGIAAVIYLIIGGLIARLIARAAPRGIPPTRTPSTTATA